MHISRSARTACLTACALLLSACGGDDPTGNSGDSVTTAEASILIQSLFTFVGDNLPLFAPAAAPARVAYGELYDPNIDATEECDVGGSATLTGTISGDVDNEAGTADLNVLASVDTNGCRFYISEVNIITLDSQPDVEFDADLVMDEVADTETDVVAVSGTVAFTITDGRSGTCSIDAVVTIVSTGTGEQWTATGTVCGVGAASLIID